MAVLLTNPLKWDNPNAGTWNGTLPVSVYSADGQNLNPGFTYISGSTIFESLGGQMYWNYVEVIFGAIFGGGGASSNPQSMTNQLITEEQAVAVYVEMVAPMLSESKKEMYKKAGINISKGIKKQAANDVRVFIENVNLKESFGVDKLEDLKPKLTLEELIKKVSNKKLD